MHPTDSHRQHRIRQEQTLEAEIRPNDTLASLSLRFNCTVADIKRLNKIHNDNEIFALKIIRVPLTAQNVLIDTLPKVHKSGTNSPKSPSGEMHSKIIHEEKLDEKLLIASVSNAVIAKPENAVDRPITGEVDAEDLSDLSEPLLVERQFRGYPMAIRAPKNDFLSFNGSDCDLNWFLLLIFILALCVIVPLIYVYLVYEHPERFNHTHSKFDDPDLKYLHHIGDNHENTTTHSQR